MEQTLILIKPDAVQRRLIGQIVARFERKGLAIVAMKMLRMSRELAERHYAVHKGKDFYEPLLDFITSGPLVAMVIEGPEAIAACRQMMGPTACAEAPAGTIRGDLGLSNRRNLVHGSDSAEAARREIELFFTSDEIHEVEPTDGPWIHNHH